MYRSPRLITPLFTGPQTSSLLSTKNNIAGGVELSAKHSQILRYRILSQLFLHKSINSFPFFPRQAMRKLVVSMDGHHLSISRNGVSFGLIYEYIKQPLKSPLRRLLGVRYYGLSCLQRNLRYARKDRQQICARFDRRIEHSHGCPLRSPRDRILEDTQTVLLIRHRSPQPLHSLCHSNGGRQTTTLEDIIVTTRPQTRERRLLLPHQSQRSRNRPGLSHARARSRKHNLNHRRLRHNFDNHCRHALLSDRTPGGVCPRKTRSTCHVRVRIGNPARGETESVHVPTCLH